MRPDYGLDAPPVVRNLFLTGLLGLGVWASAALHLTTAAARREALEEIARVLKPGGELILADIRHLSEYAAVLRSRGLTVTVEGSPVARLLLTIVTFGALRPGVLRGGRPG